VVDHARARAGAATCRRRLLGCHRMRTRSSRDRIAASRMKQGTAAAFTHDLPVIQTLSCPPGVPSSNITITSSCRPAQMTHPHSRRYGAAARPPKSACGGRTEAGSYSCAADRGDSPAAAPLPVIRSDTLSNPQLAVIACHIRGFDLFERSRTAPDPACGHPDGYQMIRCLGASLSNTRAFILLSSLLRRCVEQAAKLSELAAIEGHPIDVGRPPVDPSASSRSARLLARDATSSISPSRTKSTAPKPAPDRPLMDIAMVVSPYTYERGAS
jgi:hypothetical protein